MSNSQINIFLSLSICLVVLTGCVKISETRLVPSDAAADPTPSPREIVISVDQYPHDSRLEWWYHNGHLSTELGREFGFHFVVFKAQDGINEPNVVAQLGIIDVDSSTHYEASRADTGLRFSDAGALDIEIADWIYTIGDDPGDHAFSAKNDTVSLSLDLTTSTAVMLHNEIGWMPTEVGSTYYYSWPRQIANGELIVGGESFEVSGTAWFDHQWGEFFVLGKPSGWQWFAIQLDNGGSLMVTEVRGINGDVIDTYGTYMDPDGAVTHLSYAADSIDVKVLDHWVSPSTGGVYPSGWELTVGSIGINLVLTPLMVNQEVLGSLPKASTYWEGKVNVEGQLKGENVFGDAYVELSGYVDPDPVIWRER